MKTKIKVISDIPRYAKIGDSAKIIDDFKSKDGYRLRQVEFKNKDTLIFSDAAFDAMLKMA